MIHLAGPGGAGKSTTGGELALRLDLPFIDLDREFTECIGNISQYIDCRGYHSYATENVRLYLSIISKYTKGVIALSSGFMTYPESVHADYAALHSDICRSSTTFVLLPSLDLETCVNETVRRQIARPFGRSPEKEEAVIRQRYAIYRAIPSAKIETRRNVIEIIEQITAKLLHSDVSFTLF